MLDTLFDLAEATVIDSDNPFLRFGDLLPVRDRGLYPLEARATPCVHAKRLGATVGLPRLYLKNETVNPTGSTKDRSAIISLGMLLESGTRHFTTSSTGNAGSAYAFALQRPQFAEMQMELFVGSNFHERAHYGDADRVRVFSLRGGTFIEAGAVAAAYARQMRLLTDGGFFSPGKREGAKLAFFEATDQIDQPIDWYVQAISSGLGVEGTYKGAKELLAVKHIRRLPRLLCVQEDTCAPQVRAWEEGSVVIEPHHVVHEPTGLALATHRGDPSRAYPYLRANVIESRGTYTAVSEAEIRAARVLVKHLEGIDICFSSSAAVAGLLKEARSKTVSPDETVVINLTGRDRAPATKTERVTHLEYQDGTWVSEDGTLRIAEDSALKRAFDRRRSGYPESGRTKSAT